MITEIEWNKLAQEYSQKGYIVIGFMERMKVGSIIVDLVEGDLPQPFRLIAETTKQDFEEQSRRLQHGDPPRRAYFYRAVTE